MKYFITNESGGCGFQIYSKEAKGMTICKVKSCIKVNNKHLCIDHLKQALAVDRKPLMYSFDGKEIMERKHFLKEVESNGKI